VRVRRLGRDRSAEGGEVSASLLGQTRAHCNRLVQRDLALSDFRLAASCRSPGVALGAQRAGLGAQAAQRSALGFDRRIELAEFPLDGRYAPAHDNRRIAAAHARP
jgi:hypothetical protein